MLASTRSSAITRSPGVTDATISSTTVRSCSRGSVGKLGSAILSSEKFTSRSSRATLVSDSTLTVPSAGFLRALRRVGHRRVGDRRVSDRPSSRSAAGRARARRRSASCRRAASRHRARRRRGGGGRPAPPALAAGLAARPAALSAARRRVCAATSGAIGEPSRLTMVSTATRARFGDGESECAAWLVCPGSVRGFCVRIAGLGRCGVAEADAAPGASQHAVSADYWRCRTCFLAALCCSICLRLSR